MASESFVAYIDESGDEGFVFPESAKGSSHWFVISAVVTRKHHDLETVKLVDKVRALLGRRPREPLHFSRMKHEQRLPYLQYIARARLKAVTVLVHKPSLREKESFREKNRLYFYATRFLLERVSWLCRDHVDESYPGDGSALVIFSNRSATSYSQLNDYVQRLKANPMGLDIEIDWRVIRPEQIESMTHGQCMGLQIADAVASAFFVGVEQNTFGFTEPRYGQMLKPIMYERLGRHMGYGLKLWPRETDGMVREREHLRWVAATYE